VSTTPPIAATGPLQKWPVEAAQSSADASANDRVVECWWLLSLYALVPLAVLIVAIDVLLLDRALQRAYLPSEPERWPFWTLIFGLPHIVASLLTMADREYLQHYRNSLLWPLILFFCISIAGYLGPQPLSYTLLFTIIATYTVIHVFSQQIGLTLMMMSTAPTVLFRWWKWFSIGAGLALYVALYGQSQFPHVALGTVRLGDLLAYFAGAMSLAVVALAIPLTRQSRTKIGTWYLWANVAMIVSAAAINSAGYTLFVILVPRIIHDVSAFIVYITHDTNRNRSQQHNALYRSTRLLRLPPILLLPAASIAIACVLTVNQHYTLVNVFILTVSFLHYYFEGFIWRGANPHRRHMSFRRG
jgi:hypothetical protein